MQDQDVSGTFRADSFMFISCFEGEECCGTVAQLSSSSFSSQTAVCEGLADEWKRAMKGVRVLAGAECWTRFLGGA